jgi:hypothetical protein
MWTVVLLRQAKLEIKKEKKINVSSFYLLSAKYEPQVLETYSPS